MLARHFRRQPPTDVTFLRTPALGDVLHQSHLADRLAGGIAHEG
jgi:hypothetical protein